MYSIISSANVELPRYFETNNKLGSKLGKVRGTIVTLTESLLLSEYVCGFACLWTPFLNPYLREFSYPQTPKNERPYSSYPVQNATPL